MKLTPSFLCSVTGGFLVINDTEKYDRHLSTLEGQEVQVTIKKYRKETKEKERSMKQSKYYWGVVVKTLEDHNGDSATDWHDRLKVQFLIEEIIGRPMRMDMLTTEKIRELATYVTTTNLSTIKFEEYLAKIRSWASLELACYVPLPGETEFNY